MGWFVRKLIVQNPMGFLFLFYEAIGINGSS